MAISTYGVVLKYGAESPTTTVAIKDFPSLLGKRSALETTTLSDDAQTYIAGIRQTEESFDFLANYESSVYAAINNTKGSQKCSLEFSDGSKYEWEGTLSASVNEGSVDAVIEMTVSITPSTVPVWTQGN